MIIQDDQIALADPFDDIIGQIAHMVLNVTWKTLRLEHLIQRRSARRFAEARGLFLSGHQVGEGRELVVDQQRRS
jgi:hypothetical protein